MASNIVTIKSFAPEAITAMGLRVNPGSKGKSVPLRYNGTDFIVRTPKMYLPVVWDNKDNADKYTIELSFRDMDKNPDLQAFYDMIRATENRIIDIAHERAVEWFKAKPSVTRGNIEGQFSTSIREPEKYQPSMRVTAYTRNGLPTFKAYDAEKNMFVPSNVRDLRGYDVIAGIECTGIWLTAKGFGATWKLAQIRVFPRERSDAERSTRAEAVVREASDVNIQNVTFSNPKMTNNNGRIVYVNIDDGPMVLKTPMLHAPFGIGVWTDDNGTKYSIDLSFKDFDIDPETKAFYDLIVSLENKAKAESATSNWFRGATGTFGSVIKQKNPNHPPTMKFNVPSDNGAPRLEVVDEHGTPVELNEENIGTFTGAKISLNAQCTGVWIHESRFGISFRALRATVIPNASNRDLTDDTEDVLEV